MDKTSEAWITNSNTKCSFETTAKGKCDKGFERTLKLLLAAKVLTDHR